MPIDPLPRIEPPTLPNGRVAHDAFGRPHQCGRSDWTDRTWWARSSIPSAAPFAVNCKSHWNQNWHRFDVPRPISRIREYIEYIRAVLKATPSAPASFSGTFYNVRDYVPFLTAPITEIPIYLAGVNPRMTELAGSHADGLILGPLRSVAYLKEAVHPNLKKGLGKPGNSRGWLTGSSCIRRISESELRRHAPITRQCLRCSRRQASAKVSIAVAGGLEADRPCRRGCRR
jgi:alkanesulfonate monooxygenase SsuD/methylene tetrahydromethanopterin reductase-like flavin-dependent oxidoreductase (luciferase family)